MPARWATVAIAAVTASGCVGTALESTFSLSEVPQASLTDPYNGPVPAPRPSQDLQADAESAARDELIVAANTEAAERAGLPDTGTEPPQAAPGEPAARSEPVYFSVDGQLVPVPGEIDAATARINAAAPTGLPPAATQSETAVAIAEVQRNRGLLSLFGNPANRRPGARVPDTRQPVSTRFHGRIVDDAARRPVVAVASLAGATPNAASLDRAGSIVLSSSETDEPGQRPIQVASAAGLARLAPNGLTVQHGRVDVQCLKPALVRVLKQIESHYGKKVVVTSGYRSPKTNKRARGSRNSLHMYCSAADIQIEGVGKWELAEFVRSMPGRGGVGTYCHTQSVHVDIGPERDWNWRCRKRKR